MAKRAGIPPKVRWQVLARDGFRCRYCGAKGGEAVLVLDHRHPVARGGSDEPANLVTACEECNQGKSDAEAPIFAEQEYLTYAANRASKWLYDEWTTLVGEAIDWSPAVHMFLGVVMRSHTYADASRRIRTVAERALADPQDLDSALDSLWQDIVTGEWE